MEVSDPEEERESPTERTALESPTVVPQYMRNVPVQKIRHPAERSLVPTVLFSTAFVVGGLALGLPVVAVLTVAAAIVGAVRVAVATCAGAGCFFAGLLSAPDAFWLPHDSQFNRYVAHCLFFVERGLDVGTAREILRSRVLDRTTESGERAFARFTQKVVPAPAGLHRWVEDGEFSIERHVFEEARRVRTRHQLRELLSQLMSRPLAPDRPLWEVRIVTDYGLSRDTVLIVRVHHALSDGVALVKLLGNHLADHPQALRLKPRAGGAAFPLNVFRAAVVAPLTLVTWLCSPRDCNPIRHGRQKNCSGGRRSVGWSRQGIRLSAVDRIRQVTRCSVNDVLMAAARGAIRDYFRQHCGMRSPPDVTVNVPLDLRYEPSSPESFPELGTGFAVVRAQLPVRTEGAIPGLWEVRRRMERLKGSSDPVVMYGAIHYLMALLPSSLCRWLVGGATRGSSLSFCSLPGPERPVLLASRRVKSAAFWMDSHPDVPVAFCVFSYAGSFYVGVSADSSTVASPTLLVKGFATHLDRMYSIVAKRKTPGQERRRSSFTAERRREEIFKPSVKEINAKLHAVQDELHEIARKLELLSMPGYVHPPEYPPAPAYQRALAHRMEELKEEFVELITELRKRKTVAGGIAIDMEEAHYDHDLDGQLRRPRRTLTSQGRRPSFTALTTLLSTSRPLLTQYAPSVAHQALYCVPSDPDMEGRGTPEQQRALLAKSNEQCFVIRGVGSYRRDNAF